MRFSPSGAQRASVKTLLRGRAAALAEAALVAVIIATVVLTTGPFRSDNLPGIPLAARAADGLITSAAELATKPTSGTAWLAMKSVADGALGTPNLKDQNNQTTVRALAAALVYARTGIATYRSKVHTVIMAAIGTESPPDYNNVLGLGRNLAPLVMAADLIRLRDYGTDDATFRKWLSAVRTKDVGGHSRWYTLTGTHEDSPNNWGAFAGASRIAASLYLGDTADVDRAARVFRGFIGDRSAWSSFQSPYPDALTWSCTTASTFTPVNGPCTKSGHNLDGAIPMDVDRAGAFTWPPGSMGQMYMGETLQGLIVQAELLRRAGYDSYDWENQALKRIARFVSSYDGWNLAMVTRHVPWVLNARYGLSIPTLPAGYGRAFGYTDWLFGTGGGSLQPVATPHPTPTPTPNATATPKPTATPAPTPTDPPGPTPSATPEPPTTTSSGSTLSVTSPTAQLIRSSSFSLSSIRTMVGWSLKSGTGTLGRYQLQVSRDGGSWTAVSLPSATSHLVAIQVATGHAYRYRARAVDTAGHAGSWSTGATVSVGGISETSSAVRYSGSWASAALASYIGGQVRYTKSSSSATLRFAGRSIAWVGPVGPTRGSAKVYVDGRYVATVSAYASTFSARRVLYAYRAASTGTHTLTIMAIGPTSHPVVAVDWFATLSN